MTNVVPFKKYRDGQEALLEVMLKAFGKRVVVVSMDDGGGHIWPPGPSPEEFRRVFDVHHATLKEWSKIGWLGFDWRDGDQQMTVSVIDDDKEEVIPHSLPIPPAT